VDRSARKRIEGRSLTAADVDMINDAADHAPPLPRLTKAGKVAAAGLRGRPVRAALRRRLATGEAALVLGRGVRQPGQHGPLPHPPVVRMIG
jgi:hypothetical protein